MRKKYLCILICLFANALAFASAANRTITGVVISGEDNEPLIGASVYVNADDLKKAGALQTSLVNFANKTRKKRCFITLIKYLIPRFYFY